MFTKIIMNEWLYMGSLLLVSILAFDIGLLIGSVVILTI